MTNIEPVLVFLLCLFIGSLEAWSCPPESDMWPCKCSSLSNTIVECRSIGKAEELIYPMDALRKWKTSVDFLIFENSSLSHLPDDLFKNIRIQQIDFLRRTKITSLSEHGTPFSGLENVLERIRAHDVDFVNGLHFDQFRNMKKLQTIEIGRCRMHGEVHSLPYLPELRVLHIKQAEISHISNEAFANLPNLSDFDMWDNKITEMKRSMFPKPSKSLSTISLSGNKLSSLPEDFFENMPNLRSVYLNMNEFVTLPAKPFVNLFRNNALRIFWMTENPLHCDCKMSWLGSVRITGDFLVRCKTPTAFHGRIIRFIDFESLPC